MAYRQIPSTFTVKATNTAQPLFGSWITAGPASFTAGACGQPITLTLGTALTSGNDASMFVKGEPAWLIDPTGTSPQNMETVRIQSILNNTITLGNQTDMSAQGGANPVTRFPHYVGGVGVGTFIMPKQLANNFLVTLEDGGTGTFLYIGCSPSMTATAYRIFKLAKTSTGTQPQYYSSAQFSPGNPFDMGEEFVYGTAGDIFNLSVSIA
jgi:hypothetical protein